MAMATIDPGAHIWTMAMPAPWPQESLGDLVTQQGMLKVNDLCDGLQLMKTEDGKEPSNESLSWCSPFMWFY